MPDNSQADGVPWQRGTSSDGNDKRRARLNCIADLLTLIPYKEVKHTKVKVPDRQKAKGYVEPRHRNYKHVQQIC